MSIIQAYKSDADGKIFEYKVDYSKHLRKLAARRREAKKAQLARDAYDQVMIDMGKVRDIPELEQFIKDNWEVFRQSIATGWRKTKLSAKSDQLLSLQIVINRFEPFLSNSHSSPRGGVQNFDRRSEHNKGKPTSYPGWGGRITYSVTSSSSFGSEYFENTPIKTGSGGGGGGGSLSYDLKLFAADFPVMWESHSRDAWIKKENAQREYVWRQLGGSGQPTLVTECPEDWVCPDPMNSKEFA
jgi:hypothetical protein